MFVLKNVNTPLRIVNFIYHKPTKYFNTSKFLKQYPDKLFIHWIDDIESKKIFIRAAHAMDIHKTELIKMYFANSKYDGLYIHPILCNNFLKWTSESEAHKYILPEFLHSINKD